MEKKCFRAFTRQSVKSGSATILQCGVSKPKEGRSAPQAQPPRIHSVSPSLRLSTYGKT